ncbi:MAG: response regulator [Clostridia bacterium]|nr:response regulator [Clostridia bacterium]
MDGTVLLMDYSEVEREKVKYILGHIGNFKVIEIPSVYEYYPIADTFENLSLIIMDISFPYEEEGLRILASLRKANGVNVPIIITTKSFKLEYKNAALKYAANDYIVKPYPANRLENSIRSLVKLDKKFKYDVSDISQISMPFEDYITKEIKFAARINQPLSIIYITLNRLNETHSEEEFDTKEDTLKTYSAIAQNIRILLRSTDTIVSNSSGDIIIALPGTNSSGASMLSERIKDNTLKYLNEVPLKQSQYFLSAYVTFPEDGSTFESLMEKVYKKASDKELMEKINAIPLSTREYAKKRYNQFSKWF